MRAQVAREFDHSLSPANSEHKARDYSTYTPLSMQRPAACRATVGALIRLRGREGQHRDGRDQGATNMQVRCGRYIGEEITAAMQATYHHKAEDPNITLCRPLPIDRRQSATVGRATLNKTCTKPTHSPYRKREPCANRAHKAHHWRSFHKGESTGSVRSALCANLAARVDRDAFS